MLTDLIKEADRCVKCGLCLPHCPTYLKSRHEAESPRGRIALIQGVAQQQLEPTEALRSHLDSCLLCRACENVCPAKVRYGELIERARQAITARQPKQKPKQTDKLIDAFVRDKKLLRNTARLLRFTQRTGLNWLARRSGLIRSQSLSHLARGLPPLPACPPLKPYYPPSSRARGSVALFRGCLTELFDRTTLDAAIQALNRCGYGVHIPSEQTCCGALYRDSGSATPLIKQNIGVFNNLVAKQQTHTPVEAILTTASGCGSFLSEYPIACGNTADKPPLGAPVMDISEFLLSRAWPSNLKLRPLNKQVAVHDPCSMTHILHQQRSPYQLLKKIPDITLLPLPDNRICCGAAGRYMITHPEMSRTLLADKIDHLQQLKPDLLVTSNYGCALHLRGGLQQSGAGLEIIHPVALLARQIA